jgi:hypothetical protein
MGGLAAGVVGVGAAGLVMTVAGALTLAFFFGGDARVSGRAVLAPACPRGYPPDPAGECDDWPVSTQLAVVSADGTEVHRVRADADGAFSVKLSKSGHHSIRELPGDRLITCDGSVYAISPTKETTHTTVVCHYGPR